MKTNFKFDDDILTLIKLSNAIEDRIKYYKHHSQYTVDIGISIGKELDLSESGLYNLIVSLYLHDLGMLILYPELLSSPVKLNEKEKETIVKDHCTFIENILSYEKYSEIIKIIRHHHEWYNGSGYPDNIEGNDIPVESRIISIVDAFNSLITERSFRENFSINDSLNILNKSAGTQFDPDIINILKNIVGIKNV